MVISALSFVDLDDDTLQLTLQTVFRYALDSEMVSNFLWKYRCFINAASACIVVRALVLLLQLLVSGVVAFFVRVGCSCNAIISVSDCSACVGVSISVCLFCMSLSVSESESVSVSGSGSGSGSGSAPRLRLDGSECTCGLLGNMSSCRPRYLHVILSTGLFTHPVQS